ncbi:forkhead box protein P2-like isoform X1 [Tachysurus ichikawai]
MVTSRDRRIRLQKEHCARGWGHMVLPSAGIAREQVATLRQGHDGLRTRDLGKRNLPIQHAQKLVHECLPHIVYFIPCAPCFHSHHCPLIVGWTSVALLQGTCGNAASALPPGLIVPTKLILLPQIRAHSTKDIFKHSCSFPPPSSTACDRIWYGSCSLHKLSTLKPRQKCVEECNLHGALLWPLGAEKMRDIKGAGLCPYWQVSLCG